MRIRNLILLVLAIIFVAIQFVPVNRTNPEDRRGPGTSPELTAVLRRACYDCHSNETVWPWYSRVAPVSWLVVDDVNHGREHLNLSDFQDLSEEARGKVLEAIKKQVKEGKMPLWFYLPLHPEAKLSEQDKVLIDSWK